MLLRRLLRTTSTYQSNPYHLLPVDACLLSAEILLLVVLCASVSVEAPSFSSFSSQLLVSDSLIASTYLFFFACLGPTKIHSAMSPHQAQVLQRRIHTLAGCRRTVSYLSFSLPTLVRPEHESKCRSGHFPPSSSRFLSVSCAPLPLKCVYVFLACPYMSRLSSNLGRHLNRNVKGRSGRASSTRKSSFLTLLELTRQAASDYK